MDRFEVNASWIVFHCYNGGEWEDTKGFIDYYSVTADGIESIDEEDLTDDDYDDSF